MDLRKHPPGRADLVVTVPLDGLQLGCDCGCHSRVVFHRDFEDDHYWTMWAEDAYYTVRWGPFRRRTNVAVEICLSERATVDALIQALERVRESMDNASL